MTNLAESTPCALVAGLPAPRSTLLEIIRACVSTSDAERVAVFVAKDPELAVMVLRLAGQRTLATVKPTSIVRAVQHVGIPTVHGLAVCAACLSLAPADGIDGFDLAGFWEDSLRRGAAAELLAGLTLEAVPPGLGLALGFVQDLGVLALVANSPALARKWHAIRCELPERRREHEHEMFATSHDAFAATIVDVLALPPGFVASIAEHHCADPTQAATPLRRLAAHAELLAAVLGCHDKRRALGRVRQILALEIGLAADEIDRLISRVGQRVAELAVALGLPVHAQPTFETIVQQAHRQVLTVELSYDELVVRLERMLAERDNLVEELAERSRQLEQLSLTDELTGVPNRRAFFGRLGYEVSRTARAGGTLIVLAVTVDRFDAMLRECGDALTERALQSIAVTLGAGLRQTDMLARLGESEFGILLPATDPDGGRIVAHKLQSRVAATRLSRARGDRLSFTVSVGLATLRGPDSSEFDVEDVSYRLLGAARAAVHERKARGELDRLAEETSPVEWQPIVGRRT